TPEDPFAASIDVLFRGGDPAATDDAASRAEAGRIVVAGVTGQGVSDADRTYLAELVASRTGLSVEEAEARVDEVIARAQSVQQDIADAARQASRVAVLAAFIMAAALAVGAAGAWFAATMGGNHRDGQTVIAFFVRRDRRVV